MNVVLVSNFLNPHMMPLCKSFLENKKITSFYFIASSAQSEERKKIGFVDLNNQSFVLKLFEEEQRTEAIEKIRNADVAIAGGIDYSFITERIINNKLTFICSERLYKRGIIRFFNPNTLLNLRKNLIKYKNNNVYYLSIGAYTPFDLSLLKFPVKKIYQWAYFPEIKEFPKERKNRNTFLWVGRMVKVKHPEEAVYIVEKLAKAGLDIHLSMIGEGPELNNIQELIKKRNLEQYIELKGNQNPEYVQKEMMKSQFFIFSSDFWEGWGATLNEAMGHGCIPIASYRAGASEILIKNEENGFIYKSIKEAVQSIKYIINDESKIEIISQRSTDTVQRVWSASYAVNKFIEKVSSILNDDNISDPMVGPMSNCDIRIPKNIFYTSF